MLTAILHGKKRGSGLSGLRLLLGQAEGAEDVLTATVFERLAYLPDSVFKSVLDQILSPLEMNPSALDEIEFWPSWWLNGQRVEPDVVMQCSETTLIVEAKRYDFSDQQSAEQLAKELLAGREGDVIRKKCVLLTIGGQTDYSPAQTECLQAAIENALGDFMDDFDLVCITWGQLFQALETALMLYESLAGGLHRLLDDIGAAYAWHGLRSHPPLWLNDLNPSGVTHSSFAYWKNTFKSKSEAQPGTTSSNVSKVSIGSLIGMGIVTPPGRVNFLKESQ